MNAEDPYIVIANLMAFRLARTEVPTPARMAQEAKIAGEMLFHAEKEGIEKWLELRRKHRDTVKKAEGRLSETKPSESSTPSSNAGDTQ